MRLDFSREDLLGCVRVEFHHKREAVGSDEFGDRFLGDISLQVVAALVELLEQRHGIVRLHSVLGHHSRLGSDAKDGFIETSGSSEEGFGGSRLGIFEEADDDYFLFINESLCFLHGGDRLGWWSGLLLQPRNDGVAGSGEK